MTASQPPRRLTRPYLAASALTLLLAVVATSVGLFVPEFYRDAEVLLPQLYGQDLLTLVAVPVLAGALYYAHQGSLRGYVVWLGGSPLEAASVGLRLHRRPPRERHYARPCGPRYDRFHTSGEPNRPSPPDRAVRSLEPHWACPRDSIHPSHPTQSLQNPSARGS
jgi:hypothetical protein